MKKAIVVLGIIMALVILYLYSPLDYALFPKCPFLMMIDLRYPG